MRIIFLYLWLAICCCVEAGVAQSVAEKIQKSAPAVVPITKEPSHHLVFENEYVRVFKVEVAPHAETLYHKHDVDYVFVTLGDSDVESVREGEQSVRLQLKDGETQFTNGGFAHKAVNNSDKPFVNVTVELKTSIGKDFRCGDISGCGDWDLGNFSGRTVLSTNHYEIKQSNLQPGASVDMHDSSNSYLIIAVSDLVLSQTEFGKKVGSTLKMKAGDWRWIAGEEPHRLRNEGNGAARWITIEPQ